MANTKPRMILTANGSEKIVGLDGTVIEIVFDENEVPAKLVDVAEPGANYIPPLEGSTLAAWYELPPDYSESDPLKTLDAETEQRGPGSNFGSINTDGSWESDDDECDVDSVDTTLPWSDLDTCGRVRRVAQWVGKAGTLVALLYMFICSLDFLGSAFKILGGKTAGGVFTNSELLGNPIAGLMIGIMATVLVQSSSTSTSIVVTMVASGIMEVQPAIPLIMGANIGTSVTNTFVSMAQSGDRREFRRAFAGATVHDMFNWLTVLILLPVEWATGYLYRLTKIIIAACKLESYKGGKQEFLTALTKPFTSLIVKVDKDVISKIAEGHEEYLGKSLIKTYCVYEEKEVLTNITMESNITTVTGAVTTYTLENVTQEILIIEKRPVEKCFSLFSHLDLGDTAAGVLLLLVSLAVLCTCLILMVKLLHTLLQGSIAKVIRRTLNSDFPGCFSWLTGYVAILAGAVMTILVQSSSVFTSALTPLVGIGMIKIERMFPLTLGSNIGTTGTGILAAMAASGDKLPVALQIAMCHLFFNISGIILFYPVPALRRIPIRLAKFLGTVTAEYRWFAMAYLICMFLLLPLTVFAIFMTGFIASICISSLIATLIVIIAVVNIMQNKCPKVLPNILRTWEFLPKCLRSLQPLDAAIMKVVSIVIGCCPCCIKCCVRKKKTNSRKLIAQSGLRGIVPESRTVTDMSVSAASSAASSALLLDRVSVI